MREIHEIDSLASYLERGNDLRDCVIQGLNLGEIRADWEKTRVTGAVFLGCTYPSISFQERLREGGALVFPRLPRLPYKPYRPSLYTREELMDGWTAEEDLSRDKRIYDHFVENGRHHTNVLEALSQRLHDHAVDDALGDLLEGRLHDGEPKKVVAIMGGHGTPRTDPYFRKVVEVARGLTRAGFFIASGGGPGMMEAANLGAWIANADDDFLDKALEIMSPYPTYADAGYVASATQVVELHPDGAASVAVPTWFYGHEPSNLFSSYIAKYFSNSLREDGLLAIAKHGIVFSPGSAGTTQEVFQDATQNHYATFDHVSPMVFLGESHYQEKTGIYPTLKGLAKGRAYETMLSISDSPEDIVDFVIAHPPFIPESA
ncbi:MAG: hypothetical protein AAF226_11215 [Verrucomicrobiota bacterium]